MRVGNRGGIYGHSHSRSQLVLPPTERWVPCLKQRSALLLVSVLERVRAQGRPDRARRRAAPMCRRRSMRRRGSRSRARRRIGSVFNLNNGTGWVGGSFFAGGGSAWNAVTSILSDPPFASSYWGVVVECAPGYACGGAGQITLRSITLSATESQGPSLSAQGSGNLWYQTRQGEWIWNAPGDPWPLTLAASDPSGVCSNVGSCSAARVTRSVVDPELVAVAAVPRPDMDTDRRRQRRHARLRARCRHASADNQRDERRRPSRPPTRRRCKSTTARSVFY